MCLTDFVPSEKVREGIGYFYIGVIITNILIHLIVLVLETLERIKLACKKFNRC